MAFISLILGDADQVKNSETITCFQQDDPMDGPEEVYPLFRKALFRNDGGTTNRLKKSEMDFSGFAKTEYRKFRPLIEKVFPTEEQREAYLNLDKNSPRFDKHMNNIEKPDRHALEIYHKAISVYTESKNPSAQLLFGLEYYRKQFQEILELSEEEYIKKNVINFSKFSAFAYNNEWFAKTFIPVDGVTEISEDEFRNKVTEIINNLPDDAPIIAMVCDDRKNY